VISKKKRWIVKVLAFLTIIAIILGIIYYLISTYTIKTVYVEGNLHYSSEEIKEIVMDGPLGSNSLYLSVKYRNAGIENIPFVDVMNVEILSPDTIKIVVYEKALAGYIEYMDNYLYFDKDGYVVENSSIMTEGIPLITGFDFEYVVMGEKLPVDNEVIFTNVMDITKLLSKYELTADKIYFASESDITVFFEDIKVTLGNTKNLEEKIMNLPQFLSKLEGKKGTLNLENYSKDMEITIFTKE
jgi:cell division protein FtsQ